MKPNSNFRNHGLTKDLNYFSTAIDLYEYSKIIPLGMLKKVSPHIFKFLYRGKGDETCSDQPTWVMYD